MYNKNLKKKLLLMNFGKYHDKFSLDYINYNVVC